jgi:hypothetical protein
VELARVDRFASGRTTRSTINQILQDDSNEKTATRRQQQQHGRSNTTTATMDTTLLPTALEVVHTDLDLVSEPEEEDALFLQLKSKATMQVEGKRSLLAAFANKDPTVLFDKPFSQRSDVQGLFTFFDADKKNSKRWTAAICARKLWVLHKLLIKQ